MLNQWKKGESPEINLVPIMDLMSVCISFLLLTAVWIQIGSMQVRQSVGGQAQADTKKTPAVWAKFDGDGGISFQLQDATTEQSKLLKTQFKGVGGRINTEAVIGYVEKLKQSLPELRTALLVPHQHSSYEEIIALMDQFKKIGVVDLGVSPL